MTTTLDLPEPILEEAKMCAIQQGVQLDDLLAQCIETGLRLQQPQPPRVRSPLPIIRRADGTVTPALTNAQLYAILDEEDLAGYEQR